ncbi:xanthine dehydrogenase [Cereibacter changlensis JA139]|uniref:Xanthine dehydrogenase n=2 Tax=Cereibacter changlensis TaxID=402884 RepID=A0A2T4JVL3_9RHOB|nr:xanthine dehydrogenase family protein molybdopterin-binding subunit [Cereibacter changlensis]PTE21951.1 xanthine dehydrogenase [Cereibacter changlensis JA139]PZX51770.1 xanthine dehydrogenase YagR molybdenum-binding subunit [Cereibacter changlensis]
MTAHLKFDKPDARNRLDDMAQGVIGAPLERSEGALKVTGRAVYAAEQARSLHGAAHAAPAYGVLVRATIPKGRVLSLGREAVLAMAGVRAVLADACFLRNPAQGTAGKAPVQGPEEVAYYGQPIALVVADSFEQARDGAQRLVVRYAEEGGALDPEAVTPELPEKKQSAQGDLDRAMREAAFSIDVSYTTPSMAAAAMEPHCVIATWTGDQLLCHGSYQMPNYNAPELADSLGVPAEKVRIVSPYVGGGFGSKLGIGPEAVAAAFAARELGCTVSVALSRPQEFEAITRRSATSQRVRLAADAEGRLTGLGHEALVSNLPDESFSEPVAQATHFTYAAAHRQIVHRIARVNLTPAGSVRAPGEAVGVLVFEAAMDELAEAAGIDPVELRLRNIPDADPETGKPFSSNMLAEALRDGAQRFGWQARQPAGTRREGEWLVGMGMASAVRVNMLGEAKARVTLSPEGTALVETNMTDIGTGTYTILTQIAAELLGLPMQAVTTHLGDSALPDGPGSGGSWGAASTGSAVALACEAIRVRIAGLMGCDEEELTLKDGRAICGNVTRPLPELLTEALQEEGHLEPGEAGKAVRNATFGAHFAEVAVNAVTGEVRVRRMEGAFACGRILNAKTARSQCLGGMTFGIGMALMEEMIHDARDGHIVNHDLAEYHVPTNADVPQLEVHFLDERDAYGGTLQAKGIGELGICGAGGAIVNAIYNACGVRVRDMPVTLDKVLEGLIAQGID